VSPGAHRSASLPTNTSDDEVTLLLARLAAAHVQLWAHEGTIHFDGPAEALPDTVVDFLRRHRDDVLQRLCEDVDDTARVLPAAAEQIRIWNSIQRMPRPEVWVICFYARVGVQLNLTALQSAVDALIARHESLRTGLTTRAGQVVRIVYPTAHAEVQMMAPAPTGELIEHSRSVAASLADLTRPPLLRVAVVPTGDPDGDVLIVATHHIVCDGMTWQLIGRDLSALYTAHHTGRTPDLPTATPFSAFVDRERTWAATCQQEALSTRCTQLGPPTSPLPLPRDPHPSRPDESGEISYFHLATEHSHAVRRTARRLKTTEFSLMLAALSALLGELTGRTDCVVAVSAACRDHQDEETAGLLRRHLLVRLRQEPQDTWSDLTLRCTQALLEAMQYPMLSCDALREAWDPQAITAVPQVLTTHLAEIPLHIDLGAGPVALQEVPMSGARCDLALAVRTINGQIRGDIEVPAELAGSQTRQRWMDRFTALLADAAQNPADPVPAPGTTVGALQ
jgi:hypothetical protein